MSKIEDSKPKNTSGAYERLFGITELGNLISKVQSTVISSGSELERIIMERVNKIPDLDNFLNDEIMPEGVFVATKRQMRKQKKIDIHSSQPDFLVFRRREDQQHCHVIELKDGHVFDTKKSKSEKQSIRNFITDNADKLQYKVSAHFCCFNQEDKQKIYDGFKREIPLDDILTGRELCDLLEIDYDEIIKIRKSDQETNTKFFISQLLKIKSIKNRIKSFLDAA